MKKVLACIVAVMVGLSSGLAYAEYEEDMWDAPLETSATVISDEKAFTSDAPAVAKVEKNKSAKPEVKPAKTKKAAEKKKQGGKKLKKDKKEASKNKASKKAKSGKASSKKCKKGEPCYKG